MQGKYKKYESNRDVISFFSGAMGLDLGLEASGLNVVIGQDFEQSCVDTMKANGRRVLGGDIRDIFREDALVFIVLNAVKLSFLEQKAVIILISFTIKKRMKAHQNVIRELMADLN